MKTAAAMSMAMSRTSGAPPHRGTVDGKPPSGAADGKPPPGGIVVDLHGDPDEPEVDGEGQPDMSQYAAWSGAHVVEPIEMGVQ